MHFTAEKESFLGSTSLKKGVYVAQYLSKINFIYLSLSSDQTWWCEEGCRVVRDNMVQSQAVQYSDATRCGLRRPKAGAASTAFAAASVRKQQTWSSLVKNARDTCVFAIVLGLV